MPMYEISVMDSARRIGAGQIRFGKDHPNANLAELNVTCHTERRSATVLLDHHSAVWLMAALGAFVAGTAQPPLDRIAVYDVDGRKTGQIQLHYDHGPIAALRLTNHTDRAAAVVAVDRRMATELMVALGAFVATT